MHVCVPIERKFFLESQNHKNKLKSIFAAVQFNQIFFFQFSQTTYIFSFYAAKTKKKNKTEEKRKLLTPLFRITSDFLFQLFLSYFLFPFLFVHTLLNCGRYAVVSWWSRLELHWNQVSDGFVSKLYFISNNGTYIIHTCIHTYYICVYW